MNQGEMVFLGKHSEGGKCEPQLTLDSPRIRTGLMSPQEGSVRKRSYENGTESSNRQTHINRQKGRGLGGWQT